MSDIDPTEMTAAIGEEPEGNEPEAEPAPVAPEAPADAEPEEEPDEEPEG